MRAVHTRPVIGLSAEFALLAVLAWTVGLSVPGWSAGIACAVITNAAVARCLLHHGADKLGPAGRVTLTRATIACGVAALTVESFWRPASATTLVALTVLALILDAVDGWVARRTGTVSAFGARFDMEVDAFLILVLSGYVARSTGAWVLAIGAARYLFVAAGWVRPWLRASVPPRYWAKAVAAVQGVVLTFAAAQVVTHQVADAALVASLALLAESFGREVSWLWRHRPIAPRKIVSSVATLHQPRVQQRVPAVGGVRSG
ncbi:MAG: CDP-alcohol phosphatidyltransferase [Pseudonocardiales bacterium]|nr:MAG: CDP-alcohol phosphatidyltransferase [Pseudonocardiales bacterium]